MRLEWNCCDCLFGRCTFGVGFRLLSWGGVFDDDLGVGGLGSGVFRVDWMMRGHVMSVVVGCCGG